MHSNHVNFEEFKLGGMGQSISIVLQRFDSGRWKTDGTRPIIIFNRQMSQGLFTDHLPKENQTSETQGMLTAVII